MRISFFPAISHVLSGSDIFKVIITFFREFYHLLKVIQWKK